MAEARIEREFGPESKMRIDYVTGLAPGARIHISGVSGTGMAAVLALLKKQGFFVTGSDKAFYPPMGEIVRQLADEVYEGYAAEHVVSPDRGEPELVVIGNNLSKDNPEVIAVMERGIRFASMPEVFAARLIGPHEQCRHSVVVAGTHGKTTTTAIIATMLAWAGREPGYFIGGVPSSLPTALELPGAAIPAEQRAVVLEGDEYDSAFFAKFSKFHCYRPDIAVITSLEFDHADIYESLEQIEREFTRFVRRVPADGVIFVCDQGTELQRAVERWRQDPEVKAEIVSYGLAAASPLRIAGRSTVQVQVTGQVKVGEGADAVVQTVQELELALRKGSIELRSRLSGTHNALNLLAAAAVGEFLGINPAAMAAGLEAFTPVMRRQQLLLNRGGVLLMEDFAHHPTAVRATLEGMREAHPGKRLIAVFEPRSNTSRRAFFQQHYAESFDAADIALIFDFGEVGVWSGVQRSGESGEGKLMNIARLVDDIAKRGTQAASFDTVEALAEHICGLARPGDAIILMSNGSFGGLPQQLTELLSRQLSEQPADETA